MRVTTVSNVHSRRVIKNHAVGNVAAVTELRTSTPYARNVSIKEQCTEIRKKVCDESLSGGLIYLEAGEPVPRNGDVFFKFRPESNFMYLTGIEHPGYAMLLDTDSGSFTLAAPKQPEDMAFWIGPQPTLEELAEQYGADRCCYTEDLLTGLSSNHTVHTAKSLSMKLGEKISAGGPRVFDDLLDPLLRRCRTAKTSAEVGCLLEANKISAQGHLAMWRNTKPGMYEYQLQATFTHTVLDLGSPDLGYPCIVGAGPNAGILHYETCRDQVLDGHLVLVDAGSEIRGYTADISRTYPANGSFTGAQRDVYDAVLEVQELALKQIKAGVVWQDVDSAVRRQLCARILDMGLAKGSVDALLESRVDRVFLPHGLGHHLGLDVHDVGDATSENSPVPKQLKEGYVVTCEPGMYFIPALLKRAAQNQEQAPLLNWDKVEQMSDMGGVRIEDDVLVTVDGCFNITMATGLPKKSREIEAIMHEN